MIYTIVSQSCLLLFQLFPTKVCLIQLLTHLSAERKECNFHRLDIPTDPEPWVFQGGFGAELTVRINLLVKPFFYFVESML